MKLTKKTKAEVLKVYDIWLHSYLNGNVDTYDKYLDDAYHFIGSTDNEEFLNRKDTTSFFEATADQIAGKCKLKNEKRTFEEFGGLVFVTHLFDAWFLNGEDWSYYGRFRFTSALQENKEGWRFIYQHFSTTDPKAAKGETIGFDQVSAENLQLKEAIKRRTFELEEKNRELEVEGALERIRAQAVAMQRSSDLLDIVVSMRTEFIKLGHEAHYFWHMMWLPKIYEKAMTSGDGCKIGFVMELPRHIHGDIPLLAKWEKSKKQTIVHTMDVEEALDYVHKMVTLGDFQNIDPQAPTEDDIRHIGGLTFIMARTSHGEIGYSLPGVVKNPPKEDVELLERFAEAFDLAHRRFLDLQKAEKQAQETQIELALEKVRSRTMAMQNSEELEEVILEVLKKLQGLGISMAQRAAAIFTYEAGNKDYEQWVASPEYNSILSFNTPYFDHPVQNDIWNARQNGTAFYAKLYPVEVKNSLFKYMFDLPALQNMPKAEKTKALKFKHYGISIAFQKYAALVVVDHSGIPLTESENSILIRLSKVFNQTYTRFLDLQKSENQAREAEIELALEKVRSRTMAMQHSDELQEASYLLDQQVRALGIRTRGCAFNIYGENDAREWFSSEQGIMPVYNTPRENVFLEYYEAGKRGESLYIKEYKGDACASHYDYLCTLPVMGKALREVKANGGSFPARQIDHAIFFKYGYLLFITLDFVPEAHVIFKRFAKVFEQTYTRFLDLQKAEAQTREAQIEMALEKVRSRTMAMQNSSELPEAANNLFLHVQGLGIPAWSAGYCIWGDDQKSATAFMSSEGVIQKPFILPSSGVGYDFYKPLKNNQDFHVDELGGTLIKKHYEFMRTLPIFGEVVDGIIAAGHPLPIFQIFHIVYFTHGYLMFITYEEVPNDWDVFKRFGTVFEQTYTRFLDLKKAESQARKAQIETALEKVRSRSMAMHTSEELLDVITVVSEQLLQLDFRFVHVSFANNDLGQDYKFWTSSPGRPKPMRLNVPYKDIAVFNNLRKAQEISLSFCTDILTKNEHNQWHNHLLKHSGSNVFSKKDNEFIMSRGMARSIAINPNIILILANYASIPYSEAENKIIARFGQVFEQSYTRFLDLQTAEKNAYKNKVEAALERVRSRAMAMQEPEELKDVAHILRTEMGLLGIEELETSSIYILDKKVAATECWYAIKEGSKNKKLVADHITMDFNATWVGKQMLEFHESKAETTSIVMKGDNRKKWITYCMAQSKALKGVYSDTIPDRTYHLQKFSHGAIGAASAGDISAETWALLKRSASVFSLAYARFKDLTQARIDLIKLKAAKKRAEEALSELQQTQTQLIQSEKMASLGELTAGIAHEIQNPLNFVNNFSEVSKELLEEMQEEIENGDFEEVKAIMEDVIQNLEKINHHGKRADGIVKGMLQHSRSSSGTKEPTDINALADEYLRLAYHGLRAKDKSFNATLETDFDDSIGTINVLPQDIGRVILNLITNAFYASNERRQTSKDESFKPIVSVSTKKVKDTIQISVKDNGNGIPKEIVDKIFQPFFTTKPTGQGTGLGLSMSYDIITKGHDGELTVETKEGEGTSFIIEIPI